ncbi:hypothetical protein [Actinosynnema mirum]|uniref:Uncharacterized protein n=1 Tax=Actinosynnema mirum (strain ATCC 29888 / DSM 43827 / JCM 3225 / NBRC 14064 / NCIMB 13271 / NRRL B-12336 / IMRU 3971 / 101) TaxID=446462 RepID=C6WLK5_ACTMD|nr:hypothetical protein [Actinosynnema mirum]ACU38398.1 hypothetical protein Amir_4559 [Actinosynnema mirum DSM 43827]
MHRRVINRYAGTCRLCGRDVPAEGGLAVKQSSGSAWEVEHDGGCPPNPHNPGGAPTWEVGGGEGYGQEPFTTGATTREQWWTGRGGPAPEEVPGGALVSEREGSRQVSGVVTVVTAREHYYAEDGLVHGVGRDSGFFFSARVRAATEAEAAPVLEAEAHQAVREELSARCARLLDWLVGRVPDAWRPPFGDPTLEGLPALARVPLRPHEQQPPHGDELLLDEAGGRLWTVVHHGGDGDDFSLNNVRGHIATCHPLTDERRRLVADLRAEYGSAYEWARAGIAPAPARVLADAGVLPHQVTGHDCAVSITDVRDATAYLARTPDQWAQAGWAWPRGRRWPAAQAGLLADAGIGHERAEQLRAAGHTTVEQALAAAPPQVPTTTGRFVLRGCTVGPRVQITDDPHEARRCLEHDPGAWSRWEHVPDVTVLHVKSFADTGWQLWSDGALSIGYWCAPSESGRPLSLSPAAEELLDLVVTAGNPEIRDRAVWHPLLTATTHRVVRVDGREESDGSDTGLVRHDVTLADGTAYVLWEVLTRWQHHGQDYDEGESRWISADEAAARHHLAHRS